MLKRIASFAMCLLLVASSLFLVACDNGNENSGDASANGTTEGFLNEAKNWGGETITILGYNGEFEYHSAQIDPETTTGDPVKDAFYNRNAFISENYGLDIVSYIPTAEQDPIALLKNSVSANLSEYDVIVCPLYYMSTLVTGDNYVYDINSLNNQYLHLDQAWWDQDIIEDLAVNNKVYFLAGDALVEDDEATWAIFFNKEMFSTNAELAATLGDYATIYDLVKDGKWTLDKMYEMIKLVNRTVGDTKDYAGAQEPDGDQYGMVTQVYDFYLFMQGCEQLVVNNDGDVPVIRIADEENVTTFDKLAEIMLDETNVGCSDFHVAWADKPYEQKKNIFANGNALFLPNQLGTIGQAVMREANVKYGILPMPKRSELQQEYATSIEVYHSAAIAIPTTNVEKLDATCYALEAMAFYGKQLVTPEYYDRTLTLKRFEDEESREMLDIIFNNKIYDMGAVFNFNSGDGDGTLGFYTNLYIGKSKDIVSTYGNVENKYQAGIDDFIAKCYN